MAKKIFLQKTINNGIFQFEKKNSGIIEKIFKVAARLYRPDCWICAGPRALTEVVSDAAVNISILRKSSYHPFYYTVISEVMSSTDAAENLKFFEQIHASSRGVHLYNHILGDMHFNSTGRRLIDIIGRTECPYTLALFEKNNV